MKIKTCTKAELLFMSFNFFGRPLKQNSSLFSVLLSLLLDTFGPPCCFYSTQCYAEIDTDKDRDRQISYSIGVHHRSL